MVETLHNTMPDTEILAAQESAATEIATKISAADYLALRRKESSTIALTKLMTDMGIFDRFKIIRTETERGHHWYTAQLNRVDFHCDDLILPARAQDQDQFKACERLLLTLLDPRLAFSVYGVLVLKSRPMPAHGQVVVRKRSAARRYEMTL